MMMVMIMVMMVMEQGLHRYIDDVLAILGDWALDKKQKVGAVREQCIVEYGYVKSSFRNK